MISAKSVAMAAIAMAIAVPAWAQDETTENAVPRPAAITADGIPPVPAELAAKTRPYFEYRTAGFVDWDPTDRSMLISTRFADTNQLHKVETPGAARQQITFETEPVRAGTYSPSGDTLLVQKDIGGNEFYQIYALQNGSLQLLTDGSSRNRIGAWSEDGQLVSFGSTMRNGRDVDQYLMNPRDPSSIRLMAERSGGGWYTADFSPDGRSALVLNYISVTKMELFLRNLDTGEEKRLSPTDRDVSYDGVQYAADGRIWVSTDEGAEFKRIGVIDPATGAYTPVITEKWDITSFDIAEDNSFIAYQVNAAGQSEMKIYGIADGNLRTVPLPPGIVGQMGIAPWGEIGFTFVSNQSAADAYSVNPETLELTRWTTSEMGGLDPMANVLPELVEIESFDGEPMSGFLYRPDAEKFPGPRPLLVDIHGGPEGQSRASFMGRANYLINERGVAIFEPNVRGSDGYGKRFISLDNGPFKREDSVKDIGAFLDVLEADPLLDKDAMGVTGGSYGGYMCYASAIRYGERFKAAICVVAISNFVTFLENTEGYRRDLRRVEYGDERDPEQRAKLMEISPLTRADEIEIPLMVATGANDPRVPASEADQIIEVVRKGGTEAWHFLAANEGHGFAKKENADYYYWSSLMFWNKFLLNDKAGE